MEYILRTECLAVTYFANTNTRKVLFPIKSLGIGVVFGGAQTKLHHIHVSMTIIKIVSLTPLLSLCWRFV